MRPLLGNSTLNTFSQQWIHKQQNYWKQRFLCCPCQRYITGINAECELGPVSECPLESFPVEREWPAVSGLLLLIKRRPTFTGPLSSAASLTASDVLHNQTFILAKLFWNFSWEQIQPVFNSYHNHSNGMEQRDVSQNSGVHIWSHFPLLMWQYSLLKNVWFHSLKGVDFFSMYEPSCTLAI
jgi:hypothetical protein